VLPAVGGFAVEEEFEILLVLGVTQGVDVFGVRPVSQDETN
jgi:hypothetical protein